MTAAIEGFLLGGAPPAAPVLLAAGLAGQAYAAAPDGDALREQLRDAVARVTARHLETQAVIYPLLRRWREAGIPVLVFKGFHLASAVYRFAAERPYGDVDVLLPPAYAEEAVASARDLGWAIEWLRTASLYRFSHEEAVIGRAGVTVEIHRFVIDCAGPRDDVQRRFTAAAWAGSRPWRWRDLDLRVLDPSDAALMGVVAARMWSGGDDLTLKATDLLDLRVLAEAGGLTRPDLVRRAEQLGCPRTTALFLRRCDPWSDRVSLRPPGWSERQRSYLAMAPERSHLGLERLRARARRVPGTLRDAFASLPLLFRSWRLLRADPTLHAFLTAQSTYRSAPASGLTLVGKERLVRGVKLCAILFQPIGDRCRLRSLALFSTLREHGAQVTLHLGSESRHAVAGKRVGRGPRVHAWVTLEGMSLRDLAELQRCQVDHLSGNLRAGPGSGPRGPDGDADRPSASG